MSAKKGAFATFTTERKGGWKFYRAADLLTSLPHRAHAYVERVVLEYLSAQPDVIDLIAPLSSALIEGAAAEEVPPPLKKVMKKSAAAPVPKADTEDHDDMEARNISTDDSALMSGAASSSKKADEQPVLPVPPEEDEENNAIKTAASQLAKVTVGLRIDTVEGKTLEKWLEVDEEYMPVDMAMQWSCELVESVALLHKQHGISHGDLKPENILVESRSRHLKLVDWGCATWGKQNTKASKCAAGTLYYGSPEMWETLLSPGGPTFDTIKNDVFAVGMILAQIWHAVDCKREGALGYKWDRYVENIDTQHVTQHHLTAFRTSIDKAVGTGFPHLQRMPKFWRDWISECVGQPQHSRPRLADIVDQIRTNKKLGKVTKRYQTVEAHHYLRSTDVAATQGGPNLQPLDKSLTAPPLEELFGLWPLMSASGKKIAVSIPNRQQKLVIKQYAKKPTKHQKELAKKAQRVIRRAAGLSD
ncbi:unnamed protein product [Amoebophrya sp. A120]|nr:unnamed protein product [Amoebophrya sp. A120]|eukprot:GSA120T00024451001.1